MRYPTPFIALVGATLMTAGLLSACKQEEAPKPLTADVNQTQAIVKGVPGGVQTRTLNLEAKVESIDYTTRQVTLVDQEGGKQTFTVGPEAVNFDKVKTGDEVRLSYQEELVIYLKELDAPSTDGAQVVAARAEGTEKPAGFAAGQIEVTAKVTAIDLANHAATLTFPNGESRTVPVRPDVELREDQVGREVVIQKTAAIAIAVDKVEEAAQ